MGVAIIIPGVSFQNKNLGKVTIITQSNPDTPQLPEEIPAGLTNISLVSLVGTELVGETFENWVSVSYNDGVSEADKGVIYSLSNTLYATIDSSTGALTVNENANGPITVIATSIKNSSIKATLTVNVSNIVEEEPSEIDYELDLALNVMIFNGKNFPRLNSLGGSVYVEGELSVPTSWGTNSFSLEPIRLGKSLLIKKVIHYNNTSNQFLYGYEDYRENSHYRYTKNQNSMFADNIIISASEGLFVDNVKVTDVTDGGAYAISNKDSRATFSYFNDKNGDYTLSEVVLKIKDVEAAVGKKLSESPDYVFKLKKLIMFETTDYTTKELFIANRENAQFDLKFTANGTPYNAGTDTAYDILLVTREDIDNG